MATSVLLSVRVAVGALTSQDLSLCDMRLIGEWLPREVQPCAGLTSLQLQGCLDTQWSPMAESTCCSHAPGLPAGRHISAEPAGAASGSGGLQICGDSAGDLSGHSASVADLHQQDVKPAAVTN